MELAEEQLALLESASPENGAIYQMDGQRLTVLWFSPGLPAFMGLSAEQYTALCSRDTFDSLYEPDRAGTRASFCQHSAARESFACACRVLRAGRIDWIQTRAKYIGERAQHPVYLAEFSNASSEIDIYQQIIDHSNRKVYIIERGTYEVLFANRPAHSAQRSDYMGQKCYAYIFGQAHPCSWCMLDRARQNHFYRAEQYFPETDTYLAISGESTRWCERDAVIQYVDNVTQNRRLQKQISESQKKYQVSVDGAGLGIWEYDMTAHTLYCPELYCDRYGLPQAMSGVPEKVLHYFVESDRAGLQKMFRDMEAGAATVSCEAWFQPERAMAPVCCRGVFSVIRDAGGRPVKAYGITQNITPQKIEQRKYRHSLEELLKLNPNALCTFRLNLTANLCGDGFGTSQYVQKLLRGSTVDELFDNIAGIITNKQDAARFRARFNRKRFLQMFAAGETQCSLSYRRKVDSGDSHWVTTYVNMLQNPDSGEVEAVAYSVDTDREKKEEEVISAITNREYDYIALLNVKTQRMHFMYVTHRVQPPVWQADDAYPVLARAIFTAEVAPEELEQCVAAVSLARVLSALEKEDEYSYSFNSGAGRKQLFYRYLNESRDEILLTRTDITEAFRQEQAQNEQLRKALLEAEHANQMKTEFLSNVSHDMRTPLNAVLGYARLAREAGTAAGKEEYLGKIERAGNILLSLINDTLDLSKIETGAVVLKKEPIGCGELIQKVITSIRPAMDEKGIRFVLDNSRAVMATVNVDALRVQEIFINLLSNAVKFTPAGGCITLTVECVGLEQDCVHDRITVSDTGCGISAGFLPKVFEPFSQERTASTASIGGSGLGLSIVRRLVELMDGTIEVHSEVGVGTQFVVCLDFERVDARPARRSMDRQSAARLRGRHVLLCEDNAMNTEIARKLLEMQGIQVTCAQNGLEGCEAFARSAPGAFDAVLMDIRMPVLDGCEAARRIRAMQRADARSVPIIAMSADAYDDDVRKCARAGMDGHIAKPIDPEKMYAALLAPRAGQVQDKGADHAQGGV